MFRTNRLALPTIALAPLLLALPAGPVLAGARPVLVDVDEHSGLMDPEQVEAAITARTRGRRNPG